MPTPANIINARTQEKTEQKVLANANGEEEEEHDLIDFAIVGFAKCATGFAKCATGSLLKFLNIPNKTSRGDLPAMRERKKRNA